MLLYLIIIFIFLSLSFYITILFHRVVAHTVYKKGEKPGLKPLKDLFKEELSEEGQKYLQQQTRKITIYKFTTLILFMALVLVLEKVGNVILTQIIILLIIIYLIFSIRRYIQKIQKIYS